jgi:DNA-directed RNA polymerase subunit RPC12/RpoP
MTYLIVGCQNCGKICIIPEQQKVRICPFCGFKIKMEKIKPLGVAQSQREVREMVTRLKEAGRKDIYSSSHHQ